MIPIVRNETAYAAYDGQMLSSPCVTEPTAGQRDVEDQQRRGDPEDAVAERLEPGGLHVLIERGRSAVPARAGEAKRPGRAEPNPGRQPRSRHEGAIPTRATQAVSERSQTVEASVPMPRVWASATGHDR